MKKKNIYEVLFKFNDMSDMRYLNAVYITFSREREIGSKRKKKKKTEFNNSDNDEKKYVEREKKNNRNLAWPKPI